MYQKLVVLGIYSKEMSSLEESGLISMGESIRSVEWFHGVWNSF